MSEAVGTFTSPTTATSGLQGYHLERKVKNLAPETGVVFRKRLLALAARRRTPMKKDATMPDAMTDTMQAMLATLSKSVTDIVTAGGTDQPKLLEQSFGEFGAELNKAVQTHLDGALAKQAPAEELYKDLGTVGRVANMVGQLADRINCIKSGTDYPGQEQGASDPASEEVSGLLDDCLQSAELAMRSAVNEHIDVAGDGDGDEGSDGQHILILKSAEAPDDLKKGIRVKTSLPKELSQFATDPVFLDQARLDRATDTLIGYGINEDALGKLFETGGLAKAFPDKTAGPADAGGGADPNADPSDPNDPGDDSSDPMQQLVVLGRLLAASMIQLDGFMRMVEGDGGDQGADPNADPNAIQSDQENTQPGNAAGTDVKAADAKAGDASSKDATPADAGSTTEDPNKKPNPFAKSADFIALEGQVADLSAKLAKVLKLPQDPKAVLVSGGGGALAKSDDTLVGNENARTMEEIAAEIEKIADPAKRAEALIKLDFDVKAGRLLVKAS